MQHLQRANYGSPEHVRRLGGVQVSTTPYTGGDALPWHEHDDAYLCLVAAGGYSQQSANHDITCEPGLLLTHPQGHRHTNRFGSKGARCISIFFADGADAAVTRLLGDYRQLRLPGADRLLTRIESELRATDDAASLALQSAVLELTAIAWRRFQQAQGVSVGEYQRHLRIELASKALGDRQRSIAEVAAAAGFSDQSHFARVFRRVMGQTPRDYRQQLQSAS